MNHETHDRALCTSSFSTFLNFVKIYHPSKGLILWDNQKYHTRLEEAYRDNRFVICRKIRQADILAHALIYLTWKVLFQNNKEVVVYTNSIREGEECKKIVQCVLKNLPKHLKDGIVHDANSVLFKNTESRIDFSPYHRLNTIIKTIHDKITATDILFDEAAFNPDMTEHWAKVWPHIPEATSIIVLSTTNGQKNRCGISDDLVPNWFYEVYKGAVTKTNELYPVDVKYTEVPYYTPEILKYIRFTLGEAGFQQEVEGGFVADSNWVVQRKCDPNIVDVEVNADSVCVPHDQEAEDIWANKFCGGDRVCGEEPCESGPIPDIRNNKEAVEKAKNQTPEELLKKYFVHDFEEHTPEEVKNIYKKDHLCGGKTIYSSGVTHPDIPQAVKWTHEDLAEIWTDLAEQMPGYKAVADQVNKDLKAKCKWEKGIFCEKIDLSSDIVKLAGVEPVDANDEGYKNDCLNRLIKFILNDDLPKNMKISINAESLCVNEIPTNISGRGIEYLFLGLLELVGEEKAIATTSKIVRKKLKKLF